VRQPRFLKNCRAEEGEGGGEGGSSLSSIHRGKSTNSTILIINELITNNFFNI
jgi:hypothetical protein